MTMTHKNPYSINACRVCGAPPKNGAVEGVCTQCMLLAGLASERGGSLGQTAAMTAAGNKNKPRFKPPSLQEIEAEFPYLEVIEVAGVGGMGVVYKVMQKMLGRVVALKILPSEIASDPSFAARFSQEARALAMLSHPNVVHLYDAGESKNYYYLLMEYVDGINLRDAIREGNLKPAEALSIVQQICKALQFAHHEGIVHRDIKPENILIDKDGAVKVADFGLAKLVDAELNLTATQQVMGTLHYMAPEQVRQTSEVDHRADLYSLGVVFYEMLTGQLPLGKFAMPSEATSVDQRLDAVVLRTLENEPDQRYQAASEIQSDIASVAQWAPKKERELEGVETLSGRMRSMLFIPAIAMVVISIVEFAQSFTWIFWHQDWPLLAAPFFASTLLFSAICMVAGWQMIRGCWFRFFQIVAILLLVKAVVNDGYLFPRLAHALGIYQLQGMETMAYQFGIHDLLTVSGIFVGLASVIVFCSRTRQDFIKAKRISRDAKLFEMIPGFSDQQQRNAARKLGVASKAMFIVGTAGLAFAVWSTTTSGPSATLLLSVIVVLNFVMIVSGIFLSRRQSYTFNLAAAWLTLLPFSMFLAPIGVLYPLNVVVGLYSLWVLNGESTKLMFMKKKLELSRSL